MPLQTPLGRGFRLRRGAVVPNGDNGRKISYVFSTGEVARDYHTIAQDGWRLDTFRQNPVFMFAHNYGEPPIGRVTDIGVIGDQLRGTVEYADADTYPFADTIFRLVKGGFLNAVSVAWDPIKWAYTTDRSRPGGIDFLQQELMEVSQAPVPVDTGALVTARAAGIDMRPLVDWTERLLDGGGCLFVSRADLETLRREAKMPGETRRTTVASDWKVGASRDLPVNTTASWDGAAAEKRIFADAGFDGESPDGKKARQAFLFYDASAPDLKGSYKEPFADVIDGKLTAVKAGLDNAASRLPQTDVPAALREEGQAVLDHYKTKTGEAEEAARAAKKAKRSARKRGLYDMMWLSDLVMQLDYLQDCIEQEAACEGDNSPIPERLNAILKALANILLDGMTEELTEMVGGLDDPIDDMAAEMDAPTRGARALLRMVVGIVRFAAEPATARAGARAIAGADPRTLAAMLRQDMLSPAGRAALADLITSRAGKVLSGDNEAELRSACEHMRAAHDCVRGVVGQNYPEGEDPLAPLEPAPATGDAGEARAARARRLRALQASDPAIAA